MDRQEERAKANTRSENNEMTWIVLLILFGFILNLACNKIVSLLGLPLYMDTVGTIAVSSLGGALPGCFVALFTNIIRGFGKNDAIYYGVLNVMIAVVAAFWMQKKKRRKKPGYLFLFALILSLIGGCIGAIQTWAFYGFSMAGSDGFMIRFFYEDLGWTQFASQFTATWILDFVDKALSVLICVLVLHFMPDEVRAKLRFTSWRQKALTPEEYATVRSMKVRTLSLGTKIITILMVGFVTIAVVVTSISLVLFRNFSKKQHAMLTKGVVQMAAKEIDGDRVEEFLTKGEAAEGYAETKELLTEIRDTYPDVEYVYVYKIMPDGCHVVFDLDTEEVPGETPGTVIEFDESFIPYVDTLLAGGRIDTIVSDDKYGWLLTEYEPVYDSTGKCVCYAAADVSMNDIRVYEYDFFVKLASLFLGFFALLLAIGLWLSHYHLVYPLNTISHAASAFAYNSEEARSQNVEQIRELNIHAGDELENLYNAFVKTTEDSEHYFSQMQHKTQMLSMLQSGLIMMLADIVENRDQSTGDHIRKTAAYTKVILEKMREMGYHKDLLTDTYISHVVKSAPLHDIGKIQIPDAILNKPGKLTDEEFEIMKKHTVAGKTIIEQTISTMPEADYLQEAMNLTTYHHEKWNGKGYPYGLAGEDIPLSARVMAVADVFDALVSRRCYKEPFSFEKAMEIIQKDAGTHFDPDVVKAFLESQDQVRAIAERFETVSGKDMFDSIA
ncbi:MAG: HD domain-containing protein [Lachnospiraceae bacterium]|nr:HD domain-containing protein [Lachnospiraceae bacterium]